MQQLQHFLMIARHGHIGRAADALNISQSGLSRSVRALESVLGLPLFEREPRGVSLTDYGQSLLVRAQVIVAEHDRAMAEARAFRALKSGDIALGLHPVLARIDAEATVGCFMAAHPAINLSIHVGPDPNMTARVATGEIDIAFTLFGGAVRAPGLTYEDLLGLRCSVYCRTAARPSVDPTDLVALAHESWVLGGGLNFRRTVEAAFVAAGAQPPVRLLQCDSLALLIDLLTRRDLFTVLPDRVAAALPPGSLVALPVPAPAGQPRGGLVYRPEAIQQPAVAKIAGHLRTVAAALDSAG